MLIDIMTDKGKILAVLDNMEVYEEPKKLLIIACYGFNGERSECHRMTVKFSKLLRALDVAVLRFDYLGLGISDGEFHHTTLSSKAENLNEVLQYVIKKMVNVGNIMLLGFSDGAVVAMQALHQFSHIDKLNSLLMWSPYLLAYKQKTNQLSEKIDVFSVTNKDNSKIKENHELKAGQGTNLSIEPIKRNRIKRDHITVIPSYGLWRNLNYYDVSSESILKFFNKKVEHFSIYGGGDATVIPTIAKLKQWNDPDKILEIPEADHTFNHSRWEREVLQKSKNWIELKYK